MKSTLILSFLAAGTLLTGCATHGPLLLDTVGPEVFHTAPQTNTGTLMVYSAMDQFDTNGSDPLNEYAHYSDYSIWSSDGGTCLRTVHNHIMPFADDTPMRVELEPGRYLVKAQSNDYGRVNVRVIVVSHRVTAVHLEGGALEQDRTKQSAGKVYLPNGQVVGAKAADAG